jgi:hypothetical protein
VLDIHPQSHQALAGCCVSDFWGITVSRVDLDITIARATTLFLFLFLDATLASHKIPSRGVALTRANAFSLWVRQGTSELPQPLSINTRTPQVSGR